MTDRTPQDQDKYVLRFPDGMRDRLKEHAALNNRSLNAEIIHRLEVSLQGDPDLDSLRHSLSRPEVTDLLKSQNELLRATLKGMKEAGIKVPDVE
ncbi:Arc family DNA-binding protein [Agrobacterium vitis]